MLEPHGCLRAHEIGSLRQAIADPTVYVRAAANLVKALESRSAARAILVGGAANLEIAPGLTTDDDDERLRQVFRRLGVPEDFVCGRKRPSQSAQHPTPLEQALDLCEPLCGNLPRRSRQCPRAHAQSLMNAAALAFAAGSLTSSADFAP